MPVFLSKNLSYLRKLKSFTQKDMAEKMGVTPSAYGNYENNYSQPNYEILEEITKVLGVSAGDILFNDLEVLENNHELMASNKKIEKEQSVDEPSTQDLLRQIEELRMEIDVIKKQLKRAN